MLYRAHRDIHLQLPADEMSVSLNIVETSHSSAFRDQYRFDVDNRKIDGILTRTSLEPMLALAAHYGGEEGRTCSPTSPLRHPERPDPLVRAARPRRRRPDSRPAASPSFEEATRGDSLLVNAMARREIARLEAGRAWIEGAAARAT